MDLENKIVGSRYQIIEKVGNRRNGYSIQSKRFSIK